MLLKRVQELWVACILENVQSHVCAWSCHHSPPDINAHKPWVPAATTPTHWFLRHLLFIPLSPSAHKPDFPECLSSYTPWQTDHTDIEVCLIQSQTNGPSHSALPILTRSRSPGFQARISCLCLEMPAEHCYENRHRYPIILGGGLGQCSSQNQITLTKAQVSKPESKWLPFPAQFCPFPSAQLYLHGKHPGHSRNSTLLGNHVSCPCRTWRRVKFLRKSQLLGLLIPDKNSSIHMHIGSYAGGTWGLLRHSYLGTRNTPTPLFA